MYPLLASPVLAGFPMTSLLSGTPEAAIWNKAVFGQVELDAVSKLAQVVYSDVPSTTQELGCHENESDVDIRL